MPTATQEVLPGLAAVHWRAVPVPPLPPLHASLRRAFPHSPHQTKTQGHINGSAGPAQCVHRKPWYVVLVRLD